MTLNSFSCVSSSNIYALRAINDEGPIKIGFTAKAPISRLSQYMNWSPIKLKIITVFEGTFQDETCIHNHLVKFRSHSEWFIADKYVLLVLNLLESGTIKAKDLPSNGKFKSPPIETKYWRRLFHDVKKAIELSNRFPSNPILQYWLSCNSTDRKCMRGPQIKIAAMEFLQETAQ